MSLGLLMLSRLICLLILALLLTGCGTTLNIFNSAYDVCPSSTDTTHQYFGSPDADDLVIFIHGLCGDAKTTWTNPTTRFEFPEELARDSAKENQPAYVVAFDYVSRLQGGPSILSIADHLEFEIGELLKKHPYRTFRIVAHSMGGLVAREYILRRQARAHPQLKVTNVVLLATPNNGNELSELGRLVSKSRQVEELRHIDKGNTYLESLNKDWNREFKGGGHLRHVLLYAGYEELAMPVLGQIVTLSSAVPYADESMGFQQDHVSIAKPKERNVLYLWVKAKLGESLEKTARHLLNGMVQQGLLAATDVPQRLPRTVELLEGLQALAGTELEKVLTYVNAGQFQAALALLAESELKENQLIENIAQRRFIQGQIYELQFEKAQAAFYYSQAVQLAPTNGWYRQGYGGLLIDTGDTQSAILQFEEAIRLSRTSRDSLLEGAALGGLGGAYVALRQYNKAHEYFEQALSFDRKIGNVRGEGGNLGNLGIVYAHLRQYTRAIEFFEQALAIARKIDDVEGEGSALGNLGTVYSDLGQYAKASESHEQALAIARRSGTYRARAENS
jgi:tetratricopeptide (TPR) repeat protein